MMSENFELVDKAKKFEELIDRLGSKKVMFSKNQLESYHAEMESNLDDNMMKMEDSIIVEYGVEAKRIKYDSLSTILSNRKVL